MTDAVDYYGLGWDAATAGVSVIDCPVLLVTDQGQDWLAGWTEGKEWRKDLKEWVGEHTVTGGRECTQSVTGCTTVTLNSSSKTGDSGNGIP